MSRQNHFLFLLLCGFVAFTVSIEPCAENLLEGSSCIIKLKTTNQQIPSDYNWAYIDSKGQSTGWKKGKETKLQGVSLESDGSLKLVNVAQRNTGTYKYSAYVSGSQIGYEEVLITVYEKAPEPTVKLLCKADNSVIVTCDTGNRTDLTIRWYKDNEVMQNENTDKLTLKSSEKSSWGKLYSCTASNPVSTSQSKGVEVSCKRTLFGFDLWIMVSILAGGGALLLLLMCVLIVCACQSCSQRKKQRQDEEELRLQVHDQSYPGTNRSKNTARGQPAPPIPQEEAMNGSLCPKTPPQPKAQVRARPPPPPQDDGEDCPPPLPRPRNKQPRNKRNQEPYRPME